MQELKEKKKGEETDSLWLARVKAALRWRMENYDTEWRRSYDLYKGEHWRDKDIDTNDPRSDDPRERITINITNSYVNLIVPFLLNDEAQYHAEPRKPEKVESAKIQESLVNYEYRKQGMQKQVQKCLYDNAIIGHAIGKTGFTLEVDKSVTKASGNIVYEDYIRKETPYFKRIDPFLFIIDPDAPDYDLNSARWVCEIYFKYYDDIINNESYSESVRNRIKSGEFKLVKKASLFQDYSMDEDLENRDYDTNLCVMFEIWDKKYNQVLTYADGCKVPLKQVDNPYPYLENTFPYVMINYIHVPNDIYGVGVPYMIEDLQLEKNRRRTYGVMHLRRFNRKYAVTRNTVDDPGKLALTTGGDGTVVEEAQSGSIRVIDEANISADHYRQEQVCDADAQQILGIDALIQGQNLPSRTTAGEINSRTNLFMLKLDDRIKSVRDFVLTIGEQISGHISNNYVTDKVVSLFGEQGRVWKRVSVEDIKDQVDWDVSSVNAPKIDPVLERQQRMQIFQMALQLLPLIQANIVSINMNELVRWVLEAFNTKDIGRFFQNALVPKQELTQGSQSTTEGGGQGSMQQQNAPQQTEQSPNMNPTQADAMQQVRGIGMNGLS